MSELPPIFSRPVTKFEDLPDPDPFDQPVRVHASWTELSNGSVVEVHEYADGDFALRYRRPLEDGTQSLLTFGLSREAAQATATIIAQRLLAGEVTPPVE